MQCTERNGDLAGAVQVFEGDDVMLISDRGTLVRTRTSEISVLGRNTQGVMLIRLSEGEKLSGLARIEEPDEDEENSVGDVADDTDVSAEGAESGEADGSTETDSDN
jgi:DNA gyrase subunit A